MTRIAILGSTGSIGQQTLDVVRRHPDRLQIVGLAAGRSGSALQQQAHEFGCRRIALFESDDATIPSGIEALSELACSPEVDLVVVSVAGVIGLLPTVSAIKSGKNIALASKEVLVAAGEIVMPLVREHNVVLTPIDSEHSAIFQCLQGSTVEDVDSLILTASGGPFRGFSIDDLKNVTKAQALNHPTWSMGGKITVDSATLMNKALEMIEARWLFGIPMDRIEIVVHQQSIIHSMVRFVDGSVLGQMGWPNMRLPIQYALLYPDRPESGLTKWNPIDTPQLSFEPVDETVFWGPRLAREALEAGGTAPCAFNAANEEAANAFLRNEIGFLDIQERVAALLDAHKTQPATLEGLLETDRQIRTEWRQMMLRS